MDILKSHHNIIFQNKYSWSKQNENEIEMDNNNELLFKFI